MTDRWMVCSACRKEISFSSTYYACSVSTCNRAATRLVFCSVPCWDSHVAVLRHRDAGAIEQTAPARPEAGAATGRPASGGPAPRAATPIAAPQPAVTQPALARPAPTPQPAAPPAAPARPIAAAPPIAAPLPAATPIELQPADEDEVLIVVSKLKKYVRDRSGMNTSDAVAERLGDHVRALCDAAIRAAAQDGRKTVLDRDVPSARR